VAKKQPTAIPFEALCHGYRLTVLNAFDLLLASMRLMDQPSVGLAVAELGQEELGKSLSILAAVALPSEPEHWNWFWSAWRDHNIPLHLTAPGHTVCALALEWYRDSRVPQVSGKR